MSRWPRARPVLCFVTDRRRLPAPSVPALLERIAAVIRAGIDIVQIRERDLPDRALVALVRDAVALTRPSGVLLLVNDRLDIARAASADGVHLPGDGISASRVRAEVPADFVIGRSVHSALEAETVRQEGGCDYLVFGTVYRSESKAGDHRVAGTSVLADVCARVPLPVLAIGGVDASNAPAIAAAGAAGVAAIGAFLDGDDAALGTRVRAMHDAFDRGSSLV